MPEIIIDPKRVRTTDSSVLIHMHKSLEQKYAGMTINERLYLSGLMDEFDKAVKDRDIERLRGILSNLELTNESIEPILKELGL